MEKRTPLYDCHVALNGKIVPFAGYSLPVQYKTGIIAEHKAVRSAAGIFDVSHMGELFVTGKDALKNIQNIVTRDISNLTSGHIAYSPVCNENGGVVDDILIYCKDTENYLLVVNASNKDKDYEWIKNHLEGDVEFKDMSDKIGQIALQGPKSEAILAQVTADIPEKYYSFVDEVPILKTGKNALISRTGYTGEDGFEIYAENDVIVEIWNELLRVGEEFGLIPCGLGARDTLRLEAAMPLYGHEMDDEVMPYEAGIGFFVNDDKKDFIGKEALVAKKEGARRRIGLVITERGIARHGDKVFLNGKEIGVVTSGSQSPILGAPICLARVEQSAAKMEEFTVEIRNKQIAAKRIPLPFYKREK